MENDKSLLEGIISDYFNSVEDAFQYRLKNEWKINTSQIILVFSVLFLTINVIPIVPALSKNYFLFLFDLLKERTILPFDQFNFWIKWLFGAIFSLVLFGLAFLFYIYWDRKNTKKALGYKFMSFCYIYSLRKELKSYLINDNEQHLEKCVKFFKNVFSKISIIDFKVDNRYLSITLENFRENIKDKYSWIDFTSSSNKFIDGIASVDNRIILRLKEKSEISIIVRAIDILTLYEFSKIKPELKNNKGELLKDKQDYYLTLFAEEVNNLPPFEETQDIDIPKRTKFLIKVSSLFNPLSSTNIFILFISWLVLLTVIFVGSALITINALDLAIDTTMLIGLLTAPFLGTIAIVTTIYSKNKK